MMDILDTNRILEWNGLLVIFYFIFDLLFYHTIVLGTVKKTHKRIGLTNVYVDRRSLLLNLESRCEVP